MNDILEQLTEVLEQRKTAAAGNSYVASLYDNPPVTCKYSIQSVTEDEGCVSVFYLYKKQASEMQLAQLFKIKNE